MRYENVHAFRVLVGESYGIKFIEDACVLYRRDKRSHTTIFQNGFGLLENSNTPSTRKKLYSEPVTLSHGVSTSFIIPPPIYGDNSNPGYFVIEFQAGHNALLIDINHSPRNVSRERWELQEVNSVDPIPSQNISKFVSELKPVTTDQLKTPRYKQSCCERFFCFFKKKPKPLMITVQNTIQNPLFDVNASQIPNINNIGIIK